MNRPTAINEPLVRSRKLFSFILPSGRPVCGARLEALLHVVKDNTQHHHDHKLNGHGQAEAESLAVAGADAEGLCAAGVAAIAEDLRREEGKRRVRAGKAPAHGNQRRRHTATRRHAQRRTLLAWTAAWLSKMERVT